MIDLLIDAPLLACPSNELNDNEFEEAFLRYVESLSEISKLRHSLSGVRIWRENSLGDVLHEVGAYPFRHSLANALGRVNPEFGFQLQDITSIATALLLRSDCLNDDCDLEDVAIDGCEINHSGETSAHYTLDHYLCRAVEYAIELFNGQSEVEKLVTVASRIPSKPIHTLLVKYQIQARSRRSGLICDTQIDRRVELQPFRGCTDALEKIDPVPCWALATHSSMVDAVGLHATATGVGSHFSKAKTSICFGKDFIESSRFLGFIHEPTKIRRLISCIVDISIGRNLSQSHALRKGGGPNDPQRTRENGWSAWRHDIDQEFHLHYWKKGNSIEFANVVVHNDFGISI